VNVGSEIEQQSHDTPRPADHRTVERPRAETVLTFEQLRLSGQKSSNVRSPAPLRSRVDRVIGIGRSPFHVLVSPFVFTFEAGFSVQRSRKLDSNIEPEPNLNTNRERSTSNCEPPDPTVLVVRF
jgi:hypothetical protein